VLLEAQFGGRGGEDYAEHGQEDKVQAAMGEDLPGAFESADQNDTRPGQVQQAQQSQGP
jgi:hypothetical protein